MKEFFLDKLEYDYQANRTWIEYIEEQEDNIPDFILKSISHIINVHHIWNARLFGKAAESDSWDVLPVRYLHQLNLQNYRETTDYLEKIELGARVNYHSSEGIRFEKEDANILYHMLTHSNYHRAQIVMDLKQQGLKHPSLNFISFRN
ncbi:MAG: DinB family protein [Flavobacteriales bacterium]